MFEHYWLDSLGSFVGSLQLFGSVARFGGHFGGSVGLSGSDSWIESVGPFGGSVPCIDSVRRSWRSSPSIVSVDRFNGSVHRFGFMDGFTRSIQCMWIWTGNCG